MEHMLKTITKRNECKETDLIITGKLFKQFITPFVEITLATGKINIQKFDPLLIVGQAGAFFIAKTVRQKGDGEGSVFFMTNKITSPFLSYICMDFDEHFLRFCRNVRKKDNVEVHFDREFYFLNRTRVEEYKGRLPSYKPDYLYCAKANNIEDIKKEVEFSIKLMADAPKRWTAGIKIPAREVKKFYVTIWRYLHRAVFLHEANGKNALVAAYSEDALRDLFKESWEEQGFDTPLFETPKRRFFMARHYVDGEDGIICEGKGKVVMRANWRILNDIAQSGLDFELRFSDFKTPYGIIVNDDGSCFMQIAENTFEDDKLVRADIMSTLGNMVDSISLPEGKSMRVLEHKDDGEKTVAEKINPLPDDLKRVVVK